MIDLDTAKLERLLPAVAGQADWSDVLSRAHAGNRRRRAIVLAVAVLMAVVGTASAFAVHAGVLGGTATRLPFEGAQPSSPESGKLVLTYDGRPELRGFPGVFVPVNQVWVYADGRVIWRQEGGPSGVGDLATGLLERSLTPDGVDLVRSKVLETGLFERDLYLRSAYGLVWGSITIHDGETLAGATWCCFFTDELPPAFPAAVPTATRVQATALSRLTELLADLPSSLPAEMWRSPQFSAHVPSSYAICYSRWEPPLYSSHYVEPSQVLRHLPSEARELLDGKDETYDAFGSRLADEPGPAVTCSEVTTDEARAIARIFVAEGFDRDPLPPDSPADTYVNWRFLAEDTDIVFSFEPILPHGQWEAMGG